MRRNRPLYTIFVFFLLLPTAVSAQNGTSNVSSTPYQEQQPQRKNIIRRFIDKFHEMDTTYITPNRYNWAVSFQNTNSFESYRLQSREDKQKIIFSPKPGIKFGPYFGWRWISLGYTFEVSSIGKGQKTQKTELEMSLYSSMLGCDLIYRRTGQNFLLRKAIGFGEMTENIQGKSFNGINIKVTGINAYYIFNHKRFSYPAAFSHSTVQRKSCGSWKAGMSLTIHEMNFDYMSLPKELTNNPEYQMSNAFHINKLKYTDCSISCGYSYNWVFKKNWLLCMSLTPAIGYKKTHTDPSEETDITTKNNLYAMHLNNLNFDITTRIGLVWNNTKHFGGLSFIMHNYNYRRNKLSIHNTFGTLNAYVGLNFHKRKAYR